MQWGGHISLSRSTFAKQLLNQEQAHSRYSIDFWFSEWIALLFGEQVLFFISAKLLSWGLFCDTPCITHNLDALKNTLKFIGFSGTKGWWWCDYVDDMENKWLGKNFGIMAPRLWLFCQQMSRKVQPRVMPKLPMYVWEVGEQFGNCRGCYWCPTQIPLLDQCTHTHFCETLSCLTI